MTPRKLEQYRRSGHPVGETPRNLSHARQRNVPVDGTDRTQESVMKRAQIGVKVPCLTSGWEASNPTVKNVPERPLTNFHIELEF